MMRDLRRIVIGQLSEVLYCLLCCVVWSVLCCGYSMGEMAQNKFLSWETIKLVLNLES